MAISVDVAKDPSAIKQKFIGPFTRRQFFCFGAAAIVGVPFYLMTRKEFGTDTSALLMIAVMLPFFFLGIYEKDGKPAEKHLMQMVRMKFLRPGIRRYEVVNIYEQLRKREKIEKEVEVLESKRKRRKKEWRSKAEKPEGRENHGKARKKI